MTKPEARLLYPPLPDSGEAALRLVRLWETTRLPQSVFCYLSTGGECATAPILAFCQTLGIPVAVPLCAPKGQMTAKIYTGQLRPGRFGIPEPPEGAPTMEDLEWAVVPGIAFDRDGFRLGRGGGYYDRWLLGRTIRTVGLCRPERLVPELPRDPWDIPVQTVITGVD